MINPRFAFAGSQLNRRAEWRQLQQTGEGIGKNAQIRLVQCHGDQVVFDGDRPYSLAEGPLAGSDIFLGEDREGNLWAARPAHASQTLTPLRGVMMEGLVPPQVLAILAQARSLIHWHESHGFCAACGAASEMKDAGYRRQCPACGINHFPRTDPVVIMAVHFRGKLLLGRQSSWQPGMYSALAGFMEPGETIEEAVAREVKEESGIVVTSSRYVASQPWPFPSSLMIGMIAEADNDAITIDTSEIEDARWFSKQDLELMLAKTHPQGFYASHPYAIAHHIVMQALAGM